MAVIKSSRSDLPLGLKVANGALSGVLGTLIVFPLDTLKSMMQTSSKGLTVSSALRQALAQGGARRLYQGLVPTLIMVAPEKAIKLGTNDAVRRAFSPDGNVSLAHGMLAGGTAGTVQGVITVPMELVKIRMQLEQKSPVPQRPRCSVAPSLPLPRRSSHLFTPAGNAARFSSVAAAMVMATAQPIPRSPTASEAIRQGWAIGQRIVASQGVRGLYQAVTPTLMRDIPFGLAFFPMHATATSYLQRKARMHPFLATLVSGCSVGAFCAGAVTPADVVKTRLQAEGGLARYGTTANAFRTIVRTEGAASLFRGAIPRMLVLAPTFGLSMGFYQMVVDWYAAL